jgi:hypothetical protein
MVVDMLASQLNKVHLAWLHNIVMDYKTFKQASFNGFASIQATILISYILNTHIAKITSSTYEPSL